MIQIVVAQLSAGIEIVLPTFINQRRFGEADRKVAPARSSELDVEAILASEQAIFDKADRTEKIVAS